MATSVASGALLILLGLLLGLHRPRRAHTVAFAAFAAVWGLVIAFGNLAQLDPDVTRRELLTRFYLASFVIVYVPLLYFTAVLPRSRGAVARETPAAILLFLPAVTGGLALVFAPEWIYRGTTRSGIAGVDDWGPLYPLLGTIFFGAFLWAVHRLDVERRRAVTTLETKRLSFVFAALLLYVSYVSAQNTLVFGLRLAEAGASVRWNDAVYFLTAVAGLVVVIAAARSLRRDEPLGRQTLLWVVLCPAAAGAISGLSKIAGPTPLDSLGLWRTASVVLIAYAILRFELFDIDVRIKRGALVAAIVGAAIALAVALALGAERVLGASGTTLTLAQFALFGGVVAVAMKAPVAAKALGERVLPSLHAPDRLDARRLEVYEAALSQAAAAPAGLDAQRDFLGDLRARLGVSDAEHALLARLVAGTAARAAATAELAPGALVAERYRVERVLGEGASGAAWLATDERLARRVVVKAMLARAHPNEAASRAFLREARLMAALDHPNVVSVYDFGYHGAVPFLALELVDGGTLHDRLERGASLPPREAEGLLRDVLAGLAHVHARAILHRDLKAGNVLLTREGRAKLSDFGIAVAEDAHATHDGLAPPGPKGSPVTMSPEVVRGLPATSASDVYAAGALLYQMLTGQTYLSFDGKTRHEMHRAILEDPPRPAPPGTDERLLRVALKALAKDAAERYQAADEMLNELSPGVAPLPSRPPT